MVTAQRTASWTPAANSRYYEVEVDAVQVGTTEDLSMDLTLEENDSYDVRVRGVNNAGPGPWSNVETEVIGNQPPPPVSNLAESSTSQGTISWAWEYPNQPVDHASFVVTATAGSVSVAGMTATVTGLGDSVTVTLTVKAQDATGAQSTAVTDSATTPAPPPPAAPGAPTGLAYTRRGYSSIDLTFNAVSGATSYEWAAASGGPWTNLGTGRNIYRTGLAENTNYTTYVRARNAGGAGAASSVTVKTLVKIAYYNPVYENRLYGYGQPYTYQNYGTTHHSSGYTGGTDNWASADSIFAVDNNLNTGPYNAQAGRWITFGSTLNHDRINSITAWWGYPGTFEWTAVDSAGAVIGKGRIAATGWPQGIGPNVTDSPVAFKKVARVQFWFYAGAGSPGTFKLREFAINARVIVGQTPVYNPA